MADAPTVDEFQRHLQNELDKTSEIPDPVERERRRLQIESSIQEAIAFMFRWKELQAAGHDPLQLQKAVRLIASMGTVEQREASDGDTCSHCDASLEGDLDFCSSCGKFQ